ncbi:MAG: isocitrate lyase/phosphoenolpyruvate mutase family protein, partial [Planctomycetales bacterium]|nr:isocitrate lyase/phosphoenolpyruvate mutase family protein [Planctomycetales bacterium]
MTSSPGRLLRDSIAEGTIQVPGATSALVARLIEQAGFEAMYLSGASLSSNILAVPDVGLFTLTELVQQATYLTRSSNLPLIVDADTGFGEALNVERTVIELEAAGVAAIQLEDQQLPKRCGHLGGKSLIEPAAFCAKLRAAATARINPDLILIGRTDARGVTSLDDAIERAKQYLDAGADWIFPEALTSKAEFERFAKEIKAPLIA